MANTELLPPPPEVDQAPATSPRTRAAVIPPERGVFQSYEKMTPKRDPKSTAIAVLIHAVLIGLIAYIILHTVKVLTPTKEASVILIAPPPPPPLKLTPKAVLAGGGGGNPGTTPVSKGHIPPPAPVPLNPPKAPPLQAPKINIPVTVDIDPKLHMANNNLPTIGMPNAINVGTSLGNGKGTGIGSGNGGGVGPGSGGNTGGGVRRVGGGVSAPVPIFTPEPEYSEEARKAKIAGNVIVYLQVDPNGRPINVRVLRGIGVGLDQKAMEAVRQYKFKPAMENGHPVTVEMNIEVNFQIF